ncbi:MAG: carboxypeptidase-like regulatory domain-containing protein [Planctomycetota bacterium]|jgi:hypothetical protein
MVRARVLERFCIGLSCLGLIVPAPVVEAATPSPAATQSAPGGWQRETRDVELDRDGRFRGLVIDAQGRPIAGAPIVLHRTGRSPVHARTDISGRFEIVPLRGGTYPLYVGNHSRLIRLWSAGTAPPAAGPMALVRVDPDVVRGQMPAEEFFSSDAVIITGLVAAMIAIPIAVHNSRPNSP